MNEDGLREGLGAAEGMKEDKASWVSFFQWLRGRGLDGVKPVSYTHLDVYKRQFHRCVNAGSGSRNSSISI